MSLGVLMAAVAGAGTFLGGLALIAGGRWSSGVLKIFISLGAGFMLAVALLEVLPESQTHLPAALPVALAGYLLIHLFEHCLVPHFHFGEETHQHGPYLSRAGGTAAFTGLALHSFFDGVAIASGFLASVPLGALLFVGIAVHKLPEGFTLGSILLLTGRSPRQALLATAGLGVAVVLGALTMSSMGGWLGVGLALSAGATLYVAASDLVPEANREEGVALPFTVFLGVLLYFLAKVLLLRAVG
ncbi:MAG: ZIP family metal transporter [Gemmatimonadota bacterium]|nr:ZIP family metal transporter [Chloroflexota bacterium]